MQLLELTLPTPVENVALDEALLVAAGDDSPGGVLRLWEPTQHFVVIGRGSDIASEVALSECRKQGLPVYRRCSGGCAIVAGPGCLMYAVILSLKELPQLRSVDLAHEYVMSRQAIALQSIDDSVERAGISDLVYTDSNSVKRKFSGNSLRISRDHLLYHGTILYGFALELLASTLTPPPREPEYRERRQHLDFVGNITTSAEQIRQRLKTAWDAKTILSESPQAHLKKLVNEKYSTDNWSFT